MVVVLFQLLSFSALARDVWIHVAGLDKTLLSQNFSDFYFEAREFEAACKASPKHPDCQLYINSDKKLAAHPEDLKDIEFTNAIVPTSKSVLSQFSNALKKAKAGDTIILSLHNHGGPTHKGNSCIYFSGTDFVCETDLAKILMNRPPGVKVLVNADGCFSGAFVDVATKDVCVTTWADRRFVGYGGNKGLWGLIREKDAKNLAELEAPLSKGFMNKPTMGSQSMKSIKCMNLRAVLYKETFHRDSRDELLSRFFVNRTFDASI